MRLTRLNIIIAIILFTGLHACNITKSGNKDESSFKFLVLSDIHIGDGENSTIKLNQFVQEFNESDSLSGDVDFIITTGDNVSFLFSDRAWNRDSLPNNRLRVFTNAMSRLKVPYYLSMGNHEYKIDKKRDSDGFFPESEILNIEKIWKHVTGIDPYYSIVKGAYRLIFMNSMRGRYLNKNFDNEQLEWFRNELAKNEHVLIFFHHPLKTDSIEFWYKKTKGTITEQREPVFYNLLSENKEKIKGIFVGHGHMWIHDKVFNSIKVYETSSFGDHEQHMFYSVEVNNDEIRVSKSVEVPFYEGFILQQSIEE